MLVFTPGSESVWALQTPATDDLRLSGPTLGGRSLHWGEAGATPSGGSDLARVSAPLAT